MGALLGLLQAIPLLGQIFHALESMWRTMQVAALERLVAQDRASIQEVFKLNQAKDALTVEDTRERAKKLRDIFNS